MWVGSAADSRGSAEPSPHDTKSSPTCPATSETWVETTTKRTGYSAISGSPNHELRCPPRDACSTTFGDRPGAHEHDVSLGAAPSDWAGWSWVLGSSPRARPAY